MGCSAAIAAPSLRAQRRAFEAADKNQDGCLDYEEYRSMLPPHIVHSQPEERLRAWFLSADKDGCGQISRHEFFVWALMTSTRKLGSDGLLAVFRRYDADASGSLDLNEFSRAVLDMGWDRGVAKELFEELPRHASGNCDYYGDCLGVIEFAAQP